MSVSHLTHAICVMLCREYHGDVNRAWSPCAKVEITSILGDKVIDSVCCKDGTCSGRSQFPCRGDLPSDDCSSKGPGKINVGGIGRAVDTIKDTAAGVVKNVVGGGIVGGALNAAEKLVGGVANMATGGFSARVSIGGSSSSGRDTASLRVATRGGNKASGKQLRQGQQCGGRGFDCWKFGNGACQDKKFSNAVCAKGLKCKRNDDKWWGCSQ